MATEPKAPDEGRAAERRKRHERPPPWRDVRVVRAVLQAVFLAATAWLVWSLWSNLITNMTARGIRTDFGFLQQPAGFSLLGSGFSARDPIWRALAVGLYNTLRVAFYGIILATILGTVVGIARLSTNWLVRKSAAAFVEALRNVPLLVLIIFFYLAVLQALPRIADAYAPLGLVVLSNRGLYVPWVDLAEDSGLFVAVVAAALVAATAVGVWRTRRFAATGEAHHRILWAGAVFLVIAGGAWVALGRPITLSLPVRTERLVEGGFAMTLEYGALLIALVLYTAAFIAEIVRGSIQAVPKGQTEASNALGLSAFQRLRYVILPQALRIGVPATGNEYLNLTKNTSLGIAIAFPEVLRVGRIAIGNGMPAPQVVGLVMLIYLTISLVLSMIVNVVNWRLQRSAA